MGTVYYDIMSMEEFELGYKMGQFIWEVEGPLP